MICDLWTVWQVWRFDHCGYRPCGTIFTHNWRTGPSIDTRQCFKIGLKVWRFDHTYSYQASLRTMVKKRFKNLQIDWYDWYSTWVGTLVRSGSGNPPGGTPMCPCMNWMTDCGKDSSSARSITDWASSLFCTRNCAKSPTTFDDGVTCNTNGNIIYTLAVATFKMAEIFCERKFKHFSDFLRTWVSTFEYHFLRTWVSTFEYLFPIILMTFYHVALNVSGIMWKNLHCSHIVFEQLNDSQDKKKASAGKHYGKPRRPKINQ